jgi:hypothetical protein
MRKAILAGLALFFCGTFAVAQIPTSGNVFFGYSFYNTNLSELSRVNTNGWEATAEGKILPFIGIIADFDAHYGSQSVQAFCPAGSSSCAANGNFTEHNYLFGPRVGISVGKFRPFAEAMVGAGHANVNHLASDTSLATALGGGIDYRLIRLVAWRLQGDYVHTRLFGSTQDNARISTGIVIRF